MKKVWIGLDIGAISAKAVVATSHEIRRFTCRRIQGRPIETARGILEEIQGAYGKDAIQYAVTTGSGGKTLAAVINAVHINEFQASSLATRFFYPEVRTVFEIGGQTSKYILLDETGIIDYGINGDCAAGTGSFIDQQAARLKYNIEDIGEIVSGAEKTARIAGRCSVFAKSDMIHAQQRGYLPQEVLKGLCLAVTRNFKATIVKGRKVERPVLFIGGVALNRGVVACLRETFGLAGREIIVPKDPEYFGALGAAFHARSLRAPPHPHPLPRGERGCSLTTTNRPLSTENVTFLRDRAERAKLPKDRKTRVYLGIDVGSVSTNLVVINEDGQLIHDIYTMTEARPIEVVSRCLREIDSKFGGLIEVKGVGTTGSGRELIGELIGADIVKDEITAHKTGAVHICKDLTHGMVDTVFEIGGQDSKFIRIEDGIVTDFTMNEACAAGTGSFLEEQAEKLGIRIKEEFAKLALSSNAPIKLGERCTVFMERDVTAHQAQGVKISDIVAGLSYSVVLNYLNRVVRGRKIGDHIFFQGGTAYNDAVAAAFANVLGKEIIVPPYNGVIGAIGAALLARDSVNCHCERSEAISREQVFTGDCHAPPGLAMTTKQASSFRGFDISKINYSIREFTCKACPNECDVQEFTVGGSETYWGDKCSSRYRKKARVGNKPILSDLLAERNRLLLSEFNIEPRATIHDPRSVKIGIPRAMYFYDRFPFWHTYLTGIGFDVIISDETNKKITEWGITSRVSEPCHPIGVAHGHVKNLLDKGAHYIWLPNMLTAEPNGQTHVRPYLCPWGMTLPFVVASSPAFEAHKKKFVSPTLHHMHGPKFLSNQLYNTARSFGVSRRTHRRAFEQALAAQAGFMEKIAILGEMALHKLDEMARDAVVLVGRPYNIFDLHVNLNIPAKIRSSYGVDVIPMDLIPAPETDITDVADHMFWNYGKKILSVAKFIGGRPNLHMIYITNFKCGPDSFIKHFSKDAVKKPFLTLQFDEHSNDAGIMTRVEAYLDSKGLLKGEMKQ